MKKCSNCGTLIDDTYNYCPECGNNLIDIKLQMPTTSFVQGETTNNTYDTNCQYQYIGVDQPKKPKKKKHKWVWLIIGFIILAIIIKKGADKLPNSKSTNATTKSATSSPTPTLSAIYYEKVDYNKVARNPDNYTDRRVAVVGKVIQVTETTFWGTTTITMRIDEGDNNIWYATYSRPQTSQGRILENDYVSIYGKCNGVTSYTALLGNQITIPSVVADYIVIETASSDAPFNNDDIISKLNVTEYKLTEAYCLCYLLEIENPSEHDISLTVNIKYYNSSDELNGVASTSDTIQAGGKTLLYDYPDEDFAYAKLEYEVSPCSYNIPMQSELAYEVIQKKEKIIVTLKNNAIYPANFSKCFVLFFKDGKPISFNYGYIGDSNSEIKPGQECIGEIPSGLYSETFDSYKIFVKARR